MEKYVIIIIIKSLISFLNLLDYTNNCVRLSIWRKGWENEWHEFIHPITFLLFYRSKINYSHLTFAQFYFKKKECVFALKKIITNRAWFFITLKTFLLQLSSWLSFTVQLSKNRHEIDRVCVSCIVITRWRRLQVFYWNNDNNFKSLLQFFPLHNMSTHNKKKKLIL